MDEMRYLNSLESTFLRKQGNILGEGCRRFLCFVAEKELDSSLLPVLWITNLLPVEDPEEKKVK